MQYELFDTFNGCLQVPNGQRLVIAMGYENRSWSIEVAFMVALEIRNVRAVIGDDGVKAYKGC